MARELLDARDDGGRETPDLDGARFLFPGLGTGNIFDAVQEILADQYPTADPAEFVGVETNSERIKAFRRAHPNPEITIQHTDFLLDPPDGQFDYIVANPPYVHYNHLDEAARTAYAEDRSFITASGQFKLDHLFIEQMLRLLAPGGVLVVLTPERTLRYRTNYSRWLRGLLTREDAVRSWLLPEWVFPNHTVEPVMTALTKSTAPTDPSNVVHLEYLYDHNYERLANSETLNPPAEARERYLDRYNTLLDNEANLRASADGNPFHDLSEEALAEHLTTCRGEGTSTPSTSSETTRTTLSTFAE